MSDPNAAPVRERGVRSRAGNAMQRTRAAVLDGAARAVEKHGARRSTMSDIALLAGIAKGTLYNHFRTKEAVYAAALEAGVAGLADECRTVAADDLADALSLAAERLATSSALRRIAADEPAVLAAIVSVGQGGVWDLARAGIADALTAAGRNADPPAVDLVLRWLTTFIAAPGAAIEAQARLVAAALPARVDQGT
jgi:AcrR family transcriptional regulator